MKKTLFAAVALLALSGAASAQLAYPGSTWANMTVNPSVIRNTPEDNNVLLQGRIEQGIVWSKIAGFSVNTYGALSFSADKNGLAYNNKLVPAVGVKLQHPFDSGTVDIGLQVAHQQNFRGVTSGPNSGTGVQLYAQYWFGWDLKR